MRHILIGVLFFTSCSTTKLLSGHSISMKHEFLPANKELISQKSIGLKYCSDHSSNKDYGFIDALLLGAHKKYGADFFLNFDISVEQKFFAKDCYHLKGTIAKMVDKK